MPTSPAAARKAAEILSSMSEDDKLRQLFCLITYSDDEPSLAHIARDLRPGGVMLRSMPLDACRRTAQALQRHAKIPLLLAANLEAGGAPTITDGTPLAKPMQIAAMPHGQTEAAAHLGTVCAREGRAAGINWAFAPVADIDFNWRSPITNTRTFGSDPETVAELTEAYVRAAQEGGLAACVKHFPGDGRDERDQHIAPSVNDLDVETWERTYGRVYRRAIRAGVMSVMVGHILFPAWERRLHPGLGHGELLPASVSQRIVTGLLRGRLGFDGLIVTDSSTMAGVGALIPRRELVPMTIAAGCDMFLFTKDYDEDLDAMREGLASGVITQARLDDAVTRILTLKASLGLHLPGGTDLVPEADARALVGCGEHRAWAADIAGQSITLVREEPGVLPLTPARYPRLLFVPLDDREEGASIMPGGEGQNDRLRRALEAEGFEVTSFTPPPGYEGMMQPTSAVTDRYDAIIYAASLSTRSNRTTVRISWKNPMGADVPVFVHTLPTIFISLENPYHLIDVPQVRTYINCYAGTEAVVTALMERLTGRARFTGRSPVDADREAWGW